MIALALSVLAASLLGSPHCAGMCGGLVAVYARGQPGRVASRWLDHLAYNGGRLVGYALLGAACGLLGGAVDLTGALAGVHEAAAGVAGILIALWGGLSLAEALGARPPIPGPPRALGRLVARGMAAVAPASPTSRALVMGLLTAGLPCGWLYLFVVTAGGTGTPWGGAAVMGLFWLGTLPVMVGLGVGVRALARPLTRVLPVGFAVAMIVLGLLAVAGRVRAPELPHVHQTPSGAHEQH